MNSSLSKVEPLEEAIIHIDFNTSTGRPLFLKNYTDCFPFTVPWFFKKIYLNNLKHLDLTENREISRKVAPLEIGLYLLYLKVVEGFKKLNSNS